MLSSVVLQLASFMRIAVFLDTDMLSSVLRLASFRFVLTSFRYAVLRHVFTCLCLVM